jgi:hypothetical protein
MNTELQEEIRRIKQSFRQLMDGAVAQSMRDKGAGYKLNWGVTLPRLHEMADELKQPFNDQTSVDYSQYDLAQSLWKEDIRECKILATLLMPPDQMLPEVCDIWMEQITSQEIAEQADFNLWQYLPFAPEKAYQWIAAPGEYEQLCGFHVLARLFMNGQQPNERGINEFIDQALAALEGPYLSVCKAARNAMVRFAGLGLVYERMAKSAIKSINLDFL